MKSRVLKAAGSPFESRCLRCDVSFPIETRKCMHCGGPTTRGDELSAPDPIVSSAYEPISELGSHSPDPRSILSAPGSTEQKSDSLFQLPDFSSGDREAQSPDEPTSIGRSLIQGLGGFVWIIVLIGFTLVRNCGGE